MTTATSRRAPAGDKLIKERDDLAAERIALERKTAADDARKAAIEARLKVIATETGESFKVILPDGSYVSASGAVAAEYKGKVPVIQTEVYLALKAAERRDWEKRGVVKLEDQWGRASSGRVSIKVFGEAA